MRDPDGIREPRQLPEVNPIGGSYRWICSRGWAGAALAARLMGVRDLWDHDAYFLYVDRYIKEEAPKKNVSMSYGSGLIKSMWSQYRDQADEIGAKMRAGWKN